ncbi:hypothetical protein RJ639_029295 [Escallonia herrerae]|uniref:Cryptochrome DASH n=1 Tax=Escallonia herrerae TaxID=1293975 RepID=A0AA88X4X6_9ASTE|nr:hypothetical protein RJ639_029295 [Escallonia herrerae]
MLFLNGKFIKRSFLAARRAQFLIECLADLKKNLVKRGLNLLIQHGKPEEILPSLVKAYGAHTVYAQKETCSEELNVERLVNKRLQQLLPQLGNGVSRNQSSTQVTRLELIWGSTMYHMDDLPFECSCLPDVYTQFRKVFNSLLNLILLFGAASKCHHFLVRHLPLEIGDVFLQLMNLDFSKKRQASKGMMFVGGESAALSRVHEYFWQKARDFFLVFDLLRRYKDTRNGMLGPDYSTKFSPWLASGSLSPRFIRDEVRRYEKERQSNDSTYWILFELMWRDYFRFLSIKYGNSLFHPGGLRKKVQSWGQDQTMFETWRDGCTGYPLIDANMKELSTTGFMSNRGRQLHKDVIFLQIVCSFLVRDMRIDWRMGAEWFETCLLDYDPCSNYGNWTYGAGNSICNTLH